MILPKLTAFLYKRVAKPIFFKIEPEDIHDFMTVVGRVLGSNKATRALVSCWFTSKNEILEQDILGIQFKNPVGLSAGFDKNAEIIPVIGSVGFGFSEVGSITAKAGEGNARPRLWRHPELSSLRVYYGLKNNGADEISNRLADRDFHIPVGISIAMTNCKETADINVAIDDYAYTQKKFLEIGDYDTINISCPNTCGGQPFTEPERLKKLLTRLDDGKGEKPMFIKVSPDLTMEELDELVSIAALHKIDGVICSNLVKKHDLGEGGLSGKVSCEYSYKQVKYIRRKFGDRFIIIGVGGLFNAEDVYRVIRAGANLVELITGMIYQGPQLIGEINHDLAGFVRSDGYNSISEVVGIDV